MRIVTISTLEAAREPWQALEGRADNVFATWEWAMAWWQAYGAERPLQLSAVYDGDRLAALLPLYRADRGPTALLRQLGHGAADELGPVCAPADAPLAAAALEQVARTALPARGLVLLERLRGDNAILAELEGSDIRDEPSPVLERAGRTWEEWLADRSSNFRSEVRRRERKLVNDHGLTYRLSTDPARLDDDLGTLLTLHRARWAGQATTAFAPARERFHRDFARRAQARGWLRLWLAEIDGRAVAAWYGLRLGSSEWYYQAGRDPEWERLRVGTVLLAHTIRAAFEDGVDTYRLGLGDEAYKERFSSGDPGLRTVILGRPRVRRAAVAAVAAIQRIPPSMRRPLTRRVA